MTTKEEKEAERVREEERAKWLENFPDSKLPDELKGENYDQR